MQYILRTKKTARKCSTVFSNHLAGDNIGIFILKLLALMIKQISMNVVKNLDFLGQDKREI